MQRQTFKSKQKQSDSGKKNLKKGKGKLSGKTSDPFFKKIFKSKTVTANDELDEYHLFVRMLGFLIRDGYTPDKAIAILVTSAKKGLGTALRHTKDLLMGGNSLSAAFEKTGYFPPEFCAVAGVGESTGNLGEALEMYAEYVERVLQMRKGFRSALNYPTILLSFVLVMMGVMLFVVAPKFVESLTNMGAKKEDLPGVSQILFAAYDIAELVGMPVLIGCIGLMGYYLLFGPGKSHIIKILGVIPKVRDVNNKLNWAQWLMLGAICIRSGMLVNPMLSILSYLPLPLELAKKKRGGYTAYDEIRQSVSAGKPLSTELEKAKVPDIIFQMIGASEKSGRLGESMRSIAAQYLYSLPMDIKAIGTVVEQIAVALVVLLGGGMVAIVAITMMSMSSSVM